jgi:glycosyltransferase involved in cell wall biosynthesis
MSRFSCPCCGNPDTEPGPGGFRRCPMCEGSFRFPRPGAQQSASSTENRHKAPPSFDRDFDWRLFLLRCLVPRGSRVLSVGPPCAELEGHLEADGYRVDRMDVRSARACSDGPCDAVLLWDVLEHAPHPGALLQSAAARLREGGLLLARIEDCGSVRNAPRRGLPPEPAAWNGLTRKTLETLLARPFPATPLFVEMERGERDFLVCAARKGDSLRNPSRRVLMVAHPDAYAYLDDTPGPRMRIVKTLLALRKAGIAVDLSLSSHPQCKSYDLVHIFHHAWKTEDNLRQAVCAKFHGLPVVVSAIYMELSETNFALRAIPRIFSVPLEAEREALLASLAEGRLSIRGLAQGDPIPVRPGIEEAQKALFELADHLIGLSLTEIRQIGLALNVHKPFTIVPNCADPGVFAGADPAGFVARYGLRDFVISVGHIEGRKNQLMLLYALRGTGLPVVVVGAPHRSDPAYFDLCRQYAPAGTLFISQLSQPELASAFAAARVHALPSWTEGASLAGIEAAMAGCNIVVGDRAGEWEYYGEEAFYCNPASVSSIRAAVERAFRAADPERRERIRKRVLAEFTFENAAARTLQAYERAWNEQDEARAEIAHPHGLPG